MLVWAAAGHTLLGEPLDGAGNRGSGFWLQRFPPVACDAPLAWFAAAHVSRRKFRRARPFAARRF